MADEKNDRFPDESLSEEGKEGGRVRQPIPKEEGTSPGPDTKLDTLDPDRPDEFGDGDRRS